MADFNIYKSEGDAMTDGVAVQHDKVDVVNNKIVSLGTALDASCDSVKAYPDGYSYHYIAAPAANTVVKASPGYVHAVILGAWVTGGTVEISDHATDGDGNVQVMLTAGATDESGYPKTVLVDAYFATGITVDTIGATQVTVIYR